MKIFHNPKCRNNFLKLVLKIILVLAFIQIFRAAIFGFLWVTIQPRENLFQILNGLDFIIICIILFLYFRPSLNDLGLNWNNIMLKIRIIYIVGFFILTTLVLSQYMFKWKFYILIFSLVFGIVIPIFEELLFRGYTWSMIRKLKGIVNPDVTTFLTVTLLFGIWQLGYIDILIRNPIVMDNLCIIMALKIGMGLILGLIAGYLRLKTSTAYASIRFQGLWNILNPE